MFYFSWQTCLWCSFFFLFLAEAIISSSATCDDEGDSVIFVDVTVIVDNNHDHGKLCAAVVLSIVIGDVAVIVVDENHVGKVFVVIVLLAEYTRERIFFAFTFVLVNLLVIGIDQGLNCFAIVSILYSALASCFCFVAAACIAFHFSYADFILRIKPDSTGV